MRVMQFAVVLLLGLSVSCLEAVAKDEKKPNKEKLVGTWEIVKGPEKGAIVEFAKDGKMRVTVQKDGKTIKREGTWTVEGNKITTKIGEKPRLKTGIIKELTDTKLTIDDEGTIDELKKKK